MIIWKTPKAYTWGRLFPLLGVYPWEAAFMETTCWEQRGWQALYHSPILQHKHKATYEKQCSANTDCLTCWWNSLLSHPCPSQEDQHKPLPTPSPQIRFSQGLSSSRGGDSSYITSRQEHIKLKLIIFMPGIKHCPQQSRRTSADNQPEG